MHISVLCSSTELWIWGLWLCVIIECCTHLRCTHNVYFRLLITWLLKLPGEIISDNEDDEDEGDGDEDEDAYMQKQREKLEAEKEAILNNKNLIAEVPVLMSLIFISVRVMCTLNMWSVICTKDNVVASQMVLYKYNDVCDVNDGQLNSTPVYYNLVVDGPNSTKKSQWALERPSNEIL